MKAFENKRKDGGRVTSVTTSVKMTKQGLGFREPDGTPGLVRTVRLGTCSGVKVDENVKKKNDKD